MGSGFHHDDMQLRYPISLVAVAMAISGHSALNARQPATVALPRISSPFGERADPFHGARRAHRGVDLPGRSGSPVLAAAPGIVRFVGRRGGYGEMIELDHMNGATTRYAHLSRAMVRPGDMVAQGSQIAMMGATGRATGSHLHFELLIGGRAVDPIAYMGAAGSARAASLPAYRAEGPMAPPPAPHRSAFARARDAAPEPGGALPDGTDAATGGK